jgi:Ca-activated chloride channel family protein
MNTNAIVLTVLLLTAAAELLHAFRCRSVRQLAFGPAGRPRRWTMLTPILRVVSLGLLAWGILTLLSTDAKKFESLEVPVEEMKRIVIAYDVSPSMYLKDAGPVRDEHDLFSASSGGGAGDNDHYEIKIERYVGPDGSILRRPTTRARRVAELIHSVFGRIQMQQVIVDVVAFYTDEAKPVLKDCQDLRAIRNVFNHLPLKYAFASGKTDVVSGIRGAVEAAKDWAPDSTTLFVFTDGGTASLDGLPPMPPSIENTIVVGVGKTGQGLVLDGQISKQEGAFLTSLAQRLNGTYYDGNEQHIPLESFESLAMDTANAEDTEFDQREYAIAAITAGAVVMGLLPVMLAVFGSSWRIPRGNQGGNNL